MMKKLLFAVLFLTAVSVQAQRTGAVSGLIIDAASASVMQGASVEVRSVSDTTFVRGASSMPDGKFTVGNLPYGDYTVEVTYMGYESYFNKLTINTRNLAVAPFYMDPAALEVGEVVVEAPMIRSSMHGDTIVYNAHAFTASEDADAEAIIKQLPGVEVRDGQVKANGKNVAQILVDGKETYGTDVAETMKTIPANMLDEVEVYDKLSDFAETTGIDDGDDYTVMNFVTGIKFAHWGDASAMYGSEDMYGVGTRWNIVTGSHRFGLNGGMNNTGAAAAFDDMITPAGMMGGGGYGSRYGGGAEQSANAKVRNGTAGMTYHYEPNEDFRLNANYRYDHSDNERTRQSETWYQGNDLYDRMTAMGSSTGNKDGHNFGLSSRWKINKRNNINMRVNGNLSDNRTTSTSESEYFDDLVQDAIYYIGNGSGSQNSSHNISGGVNYGVRLGDKGRNFRIGVNAKTSKGDGDNWLDNHIDRHISTLPEITDSISNTRGLNDSRGHSVRTRIEYFEPLSQYTYLSARYESGYQYSEGNRRTEKLDGQTWEEWAEGGNIMSERDYTHLVGPGLNWKKNNDRLRVNANYKYTLMKGNRTLPTPAWRSDVDFNNYVFDIEYQRQITPQRSIDMSVGSDTRNPSLGDLQGVDDISTSGTTVSGGNPGLKPYYYYMAAIGYSSYNLHTSSSWNIRANGMVSTRSMATDRYIVEDPAGWTSPNGTWLAPAQEYYRPINIDRGSWDVDVNGYYGRPLKFIKSNMNVGGSLGYSEDPGRVNGEDNTAKNQTARLWTSVYTNISEDINISADYSFTQSWRTNSNRSYRDTRTLGHHAAFDFYWLTWKNFVVRANLAYQHSRSAQDGQKDYVQERTMANFALGKKMLKKNAELTLAVQDIFNQAKMNNRSYSIDRVTYTDDRSIGRYYSLTFSYRLRNFSRSEGMERPGRRG